MHGRQDSGMGRVGLVGLRELPIVRGLPVCRREGTSEITRAGTCPCLLGSCSSGFLGVVLPWEWMWEWEWVGVVDGRACLWGTWPSRGGNAMSRRQGACPH